MADKKPYKIAILSRSFSKCSPEPLELLHAQGYKVDLQRNDLPQDRELIVKLIGNADAVITGSEIIDRYVLDHCPNLKIVSKHGVGLDSIDLELAKERGILVTNTPDTNNESVADLAIMLMLNILRQFRRNEIHSDTPNWKTKELSNDLFGKTAGLVGFGKIGQAVARRLLGFSCEILVCDPYADVKDFALHNIATCTLEELLQRSDIVSLHLPLTKSTKHLINSETLAMMKSEAVLINTSRGGIIDEQALYEALKEGKIKGAGLDVYAQEPPIENKLLRLDNVVGTPHVATHTEESNYRMGIAAARNIIDYFERLEEERSVHSL